jgi:hypothetical protein
MTAHSCLVAIALAACGRAAAQDEPPPPVHLTNPEMVRFHMRRHFDDLRDVERLLVAGKLADAKSRAYLLTRATTDPGLAEQAIEADRLVGAARALVGATTLAQACRLEAQVAVACASCHVRAQQTLTFRATKLPADEPTTPARMARHQWAADRLWEGMVAGSKRPWREGLDVLAASPLLVSPRADAVRLAERLQKLAVGALATVDDGSETLDSRATAYGDMLATCAACHLATRPR